MMADHAVKVLFWIRNQSTPISKTFQVENTMWMNITAKSDLLMMAKTQDGSELSG